MALTGVVAYVAPLPFLGLGTALNMTPVGWGVTMVVGAVWVVSNLRNHRRRGDSETALAKKVVAARRAYQGGSSVDAPDSAETAEELTRSIREEYDKGRPNPSLGGVVEPTHASLDMLYMTSKGGYASTIVPSTHPKFSTASPILLYLAGVSVKSLWDVCNQASRRRGRSKLIWRFAQNIHSDVSNSIQATSILAHLLETCAELYLSRYGWFDELLNNVDLVKGIPAGTFKRNFHFAINQYWHAINVWVNTPDFLEEAEFKELLARSLSHFIGATMTVAPYIVASQIPSYHALTLLQSCFVRISNSKIPIVSKFSTFAMLQIVSGAISSLLIYLVFESLEANDLARHRYVMKRLEELMFSLDNV